VIKLTKPIRPFDRIHGGSETLVLFTAISGQQSLKPGNSAGFTSQEHRWQLLYSGSSPTIE